MLQARITRFSLCAQQGLVFLWQNFVLLGEGVSLERDSQIKVPPLKNVILPLLVRLVCKRLQIGTDMLLTITSTDITDFLDLSAPMTSNDLEPPKWRFWWFFHNFWLQRTFQDSVATKWPDIDQVNLHIKFSLSVDFSSPSSNALGSKRSAQAGVKKGYPLKSGYFTAID